MRYDIVFFGGIYPKEMEKEIYQKNISGLQIAANQLQWAFLHGFDQILSKPIRIFNLMYIGSYPKRYKDIRIKSFRFSHTEGAKDYNIGFINITGIKEIFRYLALMVPLRKWVRKKTKLEKVVIIYSVQSLWLLAAKKIKDWNKNIHICLMVPDLPDYMSMSRNKYFLHRINKKYMIYQCKKKIRYIDSFVFLTEYMKDYFHTDKPYVVVEGIVSQENGNEEKTGISDQEVWYRNGKTVLYTGSLEKKYGIIDLMEAFRQIKREDYRLMICGDGEAKQEVLQAAKTDRRFIFMGLLEHKEILKLQRKVTVLINPRRNNQEFTKYSFPSKLLEYLASGTPVIAYKLEGIPKEYDDYIYYIQGNRPEDLANKIVEICEKSEEERHEFGKNARNFVEMNKNPVIQVKKITEMIDKSLASSDVN